MLTIQDALGRQNLKGTKILFTWVKGKKSRPWSPTQDSLMIATRLGMQVTLCNPPEYDLDPSVLEICENNAANNGGRFIRTDKFRESSEGQEIIYARHWSTEEQSQNPEQNQDWYCDADVVPN